MVRTNIRGFSRFTVAGPIHYLGSHSSNGIVRFESRSGCQRRPSSFRCVRDFLLMRRLDSNFTLSSKDIGEALEHRQDDLSSSVRLASTGGPETQSEL